MKTHTDVTIWLGEDPINVDVRHTEGCAWAWVDGVVTIHAPGETGNQDLELLENFFRRGLDAVIEARHPRLAGIVDDK